MTSFLENLNTFLRILTDSKCHKLIQYDWRTIGFKGLKIGGLGTAEFSLAEFHTEIKQLVESVPEVALALDDHQFRVWQLLTHPDLKKDNTTEEHKMYKLALYGANNHMLVLRTTLAATKQDPIGQRGNLSDTVQDIRNFVKSVSPDELRIDLKKDEQRIALSNAANIGFSTGKAKNKQWLFKDLEGQIREANRDIETKLMRIIRQRRNLSVQLPTDRRPSISELVSILETNGLIPRGGEERSREFAEEITRFDNRIDKNEQITPQEFEQSKYALAVAWFELMLED